jgi:hypothetical protein
MLPFCRALVRSAQQQLAGQVPQLLSLLDLGPDMGTAAADVMQALQGISVGPGSVFWGARAPSNLSAKVAALRASAPVQRVINAAISAAPGLGHGPTTFYIGVSVSASHVVSGSVGLGWHVGPNNEQFIGLSLGLGGVTNIGIQEVVNLGAVNLGVMAGAPHSFKGMGCRLQIDLEEVAQAALGVTGTIPLRMIDWNNCGPHLLLAVGAGELRVDLAGALPILSTWATFNGHGCLNRLYAWIGPLTVAHPVAANGAAI